MSRYMCKTVTDQFLAKTCVKLIQHRGFCNTPQGMWLGGRGSVLAGFLTKLMTKCRKQVVGNFAGTFSIPGKVAA